MIDAKRGKISPRQLFCIFFVSRLVVSLTYVQSVSVGKFDTDVSISFALSMLLTFLMSIPAVLCVKKKKSPHLYSALGVAYLLYFLFFSSLTVERFAYFATTKMNPESPTIMFIILAFVAVCYGAYLGIEPLGRFASLCGTLLAVVIAVVLIFNIKNFDFVNFFPVMRNDTRHFLMNCVLFTCNCIEPVLLLNLADKTNGDSIKPYFSGLGCAYAGVFMLLLFCSGVLGNSADLQSFPIYTLFQMASVNDMSRLDILHTSFWIFAVFLKTAVMLFCASTLIKKYSHKTKVLVLSGVSLLGSVFMDKVLGMRIAEASKYITVGMFLAFAVVVPLCILIFDRRKNVEKNI